MTRDLTRLEGLFVGGSGGAAVAGALKYARGMAERGEAIVNGRSARILVFLADAGHKYLSKIFNDEWMRENGFLEDTPGLGTVRDILASRESRPLVTARPDARLRDVIALMKSTSISQLPVVDARQALGHRRRGRRAPRARLGRQDAGLDHHRSRRRRLRHGDAEHEGRALAGSPFRRQGRHRRGRRPRRRHRDPHRSHRLLLEAGCQRRVGVAHPRSDSIHRCTSASKPPMSIECDQSSVSPAPAPAARDR